MSSLCQLPQGLQFIDSAKLLLLIISLMFVLSSLSNFPWSIIITTPFPYSLVLLSLFLSFGKSKALLKSKLSSPHHTCAAGKEEPGWLTSLPVGNSEPSAPPGHRAALRLPRTFTLPFSKVTLQSLLFSQAIMFPFPTSLLMDYLESHMQLCCQISSAAGPSSALLLHQFLFSLLIQG